MGEMSRCDVCNAPTSSDLLVTIDGRTVCARCKPDVVLNLKSGVSGGLRISPEKAEEIRKKISRLNLLSFVFAVPGIGLQFFGAALFGGRPTSDTVALVMMLRVIGAPLIIAGLACYALMKGRSWTLGLLGLLSCLGILILAVFSKRCHNCRTTAWYRMKECQACGAPM